MCGFGLFPHFECKTQLAGTEQSTTLRDPLYMGIFTIDTSGIAVNNLV